MSWIVFSVHGLIQVEKGSHDFTCVTTWSGNQDNLAVISFDNFFIILIKEQIREREEAITYEKKCSLKLADGVRL